MWLHHLWHLSQAAWALMVNKTGTSTLGLFVWVVLVGFIVWVGRRVVAWSESRKAGAAGAQAFRDSLREGNRDALIGLGGFVIVALMAWPCFIPVVIYRDHQTQVQMILTLQNRPSVINELRAKLSASEAEAKRNSQVASYWRDAFIASSKGETVPDRVLSVENQDRLHKALGALRKSREPKFITVLIGPAFFDDQESTYLAVSLLRIFRDSGWKATWPMATPKLLKPMIQRMPVGISIYTDQPIDMGSWLMSILKDVGLETYVATDTPPGFRGTFICVGYKQQPRQIQP
jgi:hypothetical protein